MAKIRRVVMPNSQQGVAWTAVPAAVALLGVVALGLWLRVGLAVEFKERVPGADRPPDSAAEEGAAKIEGKLATAGGRPSSLPGLWPFFRGPNLDGVSPDSAALAAKWPQDGPRVFWKINVGEGYAGAAVWKGRVFVLDYDREKQADALRCLSLGDGEEIWRYSYPVKIKRNHGMSRTVPAVSDKYLVAIGPKCHVTCLHPETGASLWMLDLVREFGCKVPPWYAGQCPVMDGERVILAPAGKDNLMIAVQCATGEVLWRAPNPRNWKMSHSSILPVTIAGARQFVYCASGGVAGVAADDGKLLWTTEEWKIGIATVPTPVLVGDGKLFFSGGYEAGSMMMQVQKEGDQWTTKTLFRLRPEVFGAAQQTPVLHQGHLYGVRPDGRLVCLKLTGEVAWTSGAQKFGLGPFLIADGKIFVMDDDGLLTMARAAPDGFVPLAQARVLQGHDAWGPMALAGGRLIVRDLTQMVCLDVKGEGQ